MARKKHAKPHEEEAGEAWLLPYSDLMTLLLALFIALFAMSQTDSSKMQALAQAFTAAFNMGGPSFFSGMGPSMSMPSTPSSGAESSNSAYMEENENLREAQEKLEQYIKENNLEDQVSTELTEDGLMIRLKEKALFASGSASLQGQAEQIVPVIAALLSSLPERVTISGHTDNVPISTAQFPSNWELSSSRAVNLMRGLMGAQPSLNPARFSALGYSEYRPIASNDTEEGRAQNRRVEVFIARSMRFSQDDSISASDGQVKTSANAPSNAMPTSTGTGAQAGSSEIMGAAQRPTPNSPGVVPAPLQR
ncbi:MULTISPECIES: flagellar motor protein MotB [Selenomonas]|uniref:OmpA family protein n=1 Tax=Selenomonas timonae TaxID=2754044 RepID=A0A7G7VMK6_9FIRM|nr:MULTISPECIES: flagellar motor protein MotB [Selenomonas]EJO17674.1 putative flagellar motor protein MotB [Selenomonas sp. FOBRC6]EKX96548.1 putative flagellar motor protein MotB [Selenomonas sp. oral taxon 138 str. F0429]QNH55349.1 OmpA family protein [Selenomonas timonae]